MIQSFNSPNRDKISEKEQKKKDEAQFSNPFKLRLEQSESSNPFKMNINEKEKSQKLFEFQRSRKADSNKTKTEDDQNSSFKITIRQIQKTNPFKINVGERGDAKLFFAQQTQKSDQIFHQIIQDNNKDIYEKQLLVVPKLKTETKVESMHYEQNIKNYKDLLRLFYNKKYRTKAQNFDENRKRSKKDGSNTSQGLSQQLKLTQNYLISKRLVFTKKEQKSKTNNYQKSEQYYLVSLIKNRQFVIFQLRQPNLKSLKPIQLLVNEPEIASSVEYDPHFGRIFYFSNIQQEIVVVGVKALEVICRVKVKYKRTNPLLYINKYKSNLYLLIVGGYQILADSMVEGSKYIEVFSISKWQISLRQIILRLGIGRISPIIFSTEHQNETCLFIIGGSSSAEVNKKNKLQFNIEEDINFSTNQTGIRIASSFIEDCFSGDESNYLLLANNINIRFNNPLQLFGGSVLFRKLSKIQKIQLFFPNRNEIFTIKIIKNDVHIIESELAVKTTLQKQQNGTLNKSLGYHRDLKNSFQLYGINKEGSLVPIQVSLNEKIKVKQDSNECQLI